MMFKLNRHANIKAESMKTEELTDDYLFTLLDKPYSLNIKPHRGIEFQRITTTSNFSGPTKSPKSRNL